MLEFLKAFAVGFVVVVAVLFFLGGLRGAPEMKFTFSETDTLDWIHSRALRVLREIEVEEKSGEAVCRACSRSKEKHLHDGRCSTSALSREFLNDRTEERDNAEKALGLIESLLKLK